jgi:hypothetical protein
LGGVQCLRLKVGMCTGVPKSITPDHLGRADYHGAVVNQAARWVRLLRVALRNSTHAVMKYACKAEQAELEAAACAALLTHDIS